MTDIADFKVALAASRIPEYMKGAVSRYILNGIPGGSFLTALMSNDLKLTFERADSENQYAVLDYIKLFYNHAPSQCWGSPEKVQDWVALRGWHGLEAQYAANGKVEG